MENFISVKPKHEILKKHIDSFYFHNADKDELNKRIIFFPNLNNALTIYSGASFKVKNYNPIQVQVEKNDSQNFLYLYGGIQQRHIISEMQTPFDKIGIVFKPLGINHFLNYKNLGLLIQKDYIFPYFEQPMNNVNVEIFKSTIIEERVQLLEEFFLKSFNENFKEIIIEKALKIIESSDDKIRIKDIAEQIQISEKTLNRKFQNLLNCSAKHYIKVYHFRNSLNQFYDKNAKVKLIDLALNNYYYDQPDFIKTFKSLTGKNPKKILSDISNLGNNIYWIK